MAASVFLKNRGSVKADSMPQEERRKTPRIDALNLLSYLVLDEKGQVVSQGVGRTLNVGEGGILLETHAPLSADHTISLFLALKNDLVDISGRIVHSHIGKEGKYHTGITFEKESDTATDIIARYIKDFQKQNSH